MSPVSLLRFSVIVSCLGLLVACQDAGDSGILDLATERGVSAPASGRDAGMYGGGVPFIDTGVATGSQGTDFVEGARCSSAARRPCVNECGVQSCLNGRWTTCRRSVEMCNGYDDDCDGNADEAYAIGSGCTNRQENGCLAPGQLVCDTNGNDVLCETEAMSPGAEICDGVDNDCDGRPDEDFPEQRCCTDDYQCPPGATCTAGQCVGGNTGGNSGGGLGGNSGASQGEACQNTLDCSFGLACSSNICEPVCFSTSDCASGLTCACAASTPDCFFTACINPNNAAPARENNANRRGGGGAGSPGRGAGSPQDNGGSPQENPRDQAASVSCRNATELDAFGRYSDSNRGAANELVSSCGDPAGGPERVYSFALEQAGEVILDTTGSTFDTVLAVRTDCDELGTEMLCDDDGGERLQSRLQFQAAAQTRYFVIVQGYDQNRTGQISLAFSIAN